VDARSGFAGVSTARGNWRHGAFGRGAAVEAYGFSTDDIEDPVLFEYRQADPKYRVLSSRPFRCTLTGVGRWGTHFELETLAGDVWGEIVVPADFMAFVLPMAFDGSRILGEPLAEHALVFTPGSVVAGATHGNTFVSVDFHHEALQALVTAAGIDPAEAPWFQPSLIPLDGSNGTVLTQLLADLGESLVTEPWRLAEPAVFAAVEREFAAAVIALFATSAPERLITGTRTSRATLAYRARQLLVSRAEGDGEPLAMHDVCAALATSGRTLQTAFAEEFGVGFREMERAARLQAAHRALLRGEVPGDAPSGRAGGDGGDPLAIEAGVTAIATRYGFWHLGRFAAYYREMFGRLPSETWRESRPR
jgi:AraC family ethanolamine operon transcriptional activator